MNEIFTVAGIAVISVGFIVILKQYKPEYAFGVALAAGLILLLYTLSVLSEILSEIKSLVESSGIDSKKYGILLRCLGISIVTKIASETCKDCGQCSVSSKVDLAGKAAVLFTAMPLFNEIISLIKALIYL